MQLFKVTDGRQPKLRINGPDLYMLVTTSYGCGSTMYVVQCDVMM